MGPHTKTVVACDGGDFRKTSSRACSASAAFDSRLGISSFSASRMTTTRRGAIIGSVAVGFHQIANLDLPAVEPVHVEGANSFVHHVGELAGDGGLLRVVFTDQRVEGCRSHQRQSGSEEQRGLRAARDRMMARAGHGGPDQLI